MALIHGGQLQQVAKQFDIATENWLDLSTGIAPLSYPIPKIPQIFYQALPQANEPLETAAKHYYDAKHILVTNGSQAAIKILPALWREQNKQSTTVYLPEQGYKEHALAWQTAGFVPHWYQDELPELTEIAENSVLVVINPNNPTGQLFSRATLLNYQEKLAQCRGLLVIDEAFIDVALVDVTTLSPSSSMANTINNYSNTLVLRSFGKFFGLAGIRIGFLICSESWLAKFTEHLGPWQVNGPAQFIAQKALLDEGWQQQQKQNLKALSSRLRATLAESLPNESLDKISGTDLFQTVYFNEKLDDENHIENAIASDVKSPIKSYAESYYIALCQQGIYVRLTDDKRALRFGLAKAEQLERLANALAKVNV